MIESSDDPKPEFERRVRHDAEIDSQQPTLLRDSPRGKVVENEDASVKLDESCRHNTSDLFPSTSFVHCESESSRALGSPNLISPVPRRGHHTQFESVPKVPFVGSTKRRHTKTKLVKPK